MSLERLPLRVPSFPVSFYCSFSRGFLLSLPSEAFYMSALLLFLLSSSSSPSLCFPHLLFTFLLLVCARGWNPEPPHTSEARIQSPPSPPSHLSSPLFSLASCISIFSFSFSSLLLCLPFSFLSAPSSAHLSFVPLFSSHHLPCSCVPALGDPLLIHHYFHGYLAGFSVRSGRLESREVIECLYACREGLDYRDFESLGKGMKV